MTRTPAPQFVTTVQIEDGQLAWRCSCGASGGFVPWPDVTAARIWDIALDHQTYEHGFERPQRQHVA